MKRIVLFPLAALLVAVACDRHDEPKSLTAPAMQRVMETDSLQAQAGASTICRAYRNELLEAKALQSRTPEDAKLRQKVGTLDAVISDACR